MPDQVTYKTQIEAVEGALPSRLPAVCLAIAAATLTALILGSNALLNWANNLPITPLSDTLLQAAQWWQNEMTRFGVTGFAASLNNALTEFLALR